jgi:ABC-type multidrug transport system fused ATPase/permease subunit
MSAIVFKRLFTDFIAQNRGVLVQLFIVVLLTLPVEAVVLPQLYSRLFTYINTSQQELVKTVLKVIIGVWATIMIFTAVKTEYEVNIAPDYLSFIRHIIFESTIKRHRTDYQDIRVGEHLARILDISRIMRDSLLWIIAEALPIILALICIIGYFFTLSPSIGGVLLGGFLLSVIIMFFMGMDCMMQSSKREAYYLMMSEKLNDSFGNLMNVYLNNSDNEEIQKNKSLEQKHTALYKTQQRSSRNTIIVLCALSIITFGFAVITMYMKWKDSVLTTSVFAGAWIVLLYYISCLLRLCHAMPQFFTNLGIIHNSDAFLVDILQPSQKEIVGLTNVIKAGTLTFTDITFQYPGTSNPVLNHFNLQIKNNEKVGILGTSGSGKTTVMKLLVGMYSLAAEGNSGQILVDNIPIHSIDVRHLRAKVNYVNQRTQLFNMTILKNIQYGNPRLKESTVLNILRKYQLDAVFHKLKYGIHTVVGVSGGGISLGMQKVVILLRGLFKPAKVVVLDEPLAGLDSKTREKIMKCIMDMCENKTLVVITHDHEIIPYMDRVVNLNKPPPKTDIPAKHTTLPLPGTTNAIPTKMETPPVH